jgi:hypothetical protein
MEDASSPKQCCIAHKFEQETAMSRFSFAAFERFSALALGLMILLPFMAIAAGASIY